MVSKFSAGCGKRTVVKFVARQLGLHVVEYNCQSIFANADRKTSAALAEAFSMAHRYFGLPRIYCLLFNYIGVVPSGCCLLSNYVEHVLH